MSHAISGGAMKQLFSAMETMSKAGVSSGDQKKLLAEARSQGVDPNEIGDKLKADFKSGKSVAQIEGGKI